MLVSKYHLKKICVMLSIQDIITASKRYTEINEERLQKAFDFSVRYHGDQKRASGEPFISHPLNVARILNELEADEDSLIAAILHDLIEDTTCTYQDIEQEFGADVATLVEGVTKIRREEFINQPDERKLASLRKTFAIMVEDIRCIIIKLADRLHNMETIGFLPLEKQQKKARETIEIFVPLAEKLNLWEVKKRLFELSSEVVAPKQVASAREIQDALRPVAEHIREKMLERIGRKLSSNANLEISVESDEISSILGELRAGNENERFDVAEGYTIRCIVSKTQYCYQLLYILHELYRAKPGTIVDYITTPKYNGYQALHTHLIDEDGQIIFVQILSRDLAKIADRGITAFWQGKKENLSFKKLEEAHLRLKWLEDMKIYVKEPGGKARDIQNIIQNDFLQKRIFVFDEESRIYDLPQEATALDFIYNYKAEKAPYVDQIFINKKQVAFNQPLQERDKVEAVFGTTPHSEIGWLDLVKTYFAKRKIQAELEKSPLGEKVSTGAKLLQQEFDDNNKGEFTLVGRKRLRSVCEQYEVSTVEALLEKIGTGYLGAEEVFQSFFKNGKKEANLFRCKIALDHADFNLVRSRIYSLASEFNIEVYQTRIVQIPRGARLVIEGKSSRTDNFQNFIRQIRKEYTVYDLHMRLTLRQRLFLFLCWTLIAAWLSIGLVTVNFIQNGSEKMSLLSPLLIYIPSIMILFANGFSLKTLRRQIRWIRTEQHYIISSIVLNGACIILLTLLYVWIQIPFDFSILLAIFLVSVLINIYQYIRTSLDTKIEVAGLEEASSPEIREIRKEKLIGYILRISGLLIWGIDPLIAKYSLSRFSGFFVSAFSAYIAALFLLPFVMMKFIRHRKVEKKTASSYHPYFFLAVIFSGFTSIFHFFSLNYTLASNAVLFLNFAPVIALLFTLLFLRHKVPYLRDRSETTKIVTIFLIGCVGSSLLVINNTGNTAYQFHDQKLWGDFLAFLSLIFDIVATIALIHYAKMKQAFSGMDFIIRKIYILVILFSPIVIPRLPGLELTLPELFSFLFLGIGTYTIAYYLAYEAYRRLDGLINYLMFNITPMITITLEILIFQLPLSINLVIGSILIIGASTLAEVINTKAQHKKSASLQEAVVKSA